MKIIALTSFCVDFSPKQDKIYGNGNYLHFATQCKLSGVENVSVIGAVGNDRYEQITKIGVNSGK